MNSPENMLLSELLAAQNNILHPEHNYYLDIIRRELTFAGELLSRHDETITAFGSARVVADDEPYQKAVAMGALIASEGYVAITGGGPGIMEAFSRGAYEAGGTSLGFSILLPHEQTSNEYLTHNIVFNYFFTRKYAMIAHSRILLFFPGGYGTLDELFETLTLVQTKKLYHKELVLVGSDFWNPLLGFIQEQLRGTNEYVSEFDDEFFRVIDTIEELQEILELYK